MFVLVERRIVLPLLAVLLLAILPACAALTAPDAAQLEIVDPWVRAAKAMSGGDASGGDMHAPAGTSAAYFTIRNAGRQPDRLLKVYSDVSEFVEIHKSETRDGVTTMTEVKGVDIPGVSSVEFKPGGLHVMFIKLRGDLNPGDKVRFTLEFEQSGKTEVEAEVKAP
jgi:hypothetical protein